MEEKRAGVQCSYLYPKTKKIQMFLRFCILFRIGSTIRDLSPSLAVRPRPIPHSPQMHLQLGTARRGAVLDAQRTIPRHLPHDESLLLQILEPRGEGTRADTPELALECIKGMGAAEDGVEYGQHPALAEDAKETDGRATWGHSNFLVTCFGVYSFSF